MEDYDYKMIVAGIGRYYDTIMHKCETWNSISEICPVDFLTDERALTERHWHKELFVVLDLSDENSVDTAIKYNHIFHSAIKHFCSGFSAAIVSETQLSTAQNLLKDFDRVILFHSPNDIFGFIEMMSLFNGRDGFIGMDLYDIYTNTKWKNGGYITKITFDNKKTAYEKIKNFAEKSSRFKISNENSKNAFVVLVTPMNIDLDDISSWVDTIYQNACIDYFLYQLYFNDNPDDKTITIYLLYGINNPDFGSDSDFFDPACKDVQIINDLSELFKKPSR